MSDLFHKLSAKPNGSFFFLPSSGLGLIHKAWLQVKTKTCFLVAIKRALNVQSKVQVYLQLGDLDSL